MARNIACFARVIYLIGLIEPRIMLSREKIRQRIYDISGKRISEWCKTSEYAYNTVMKASSYGVSREMAEIIAASMGVEIKDLEA